MVVFFCLKGKNPPVLLLLHQLPSLPYPLIPDGPYLGGRWRQCFCLHALPQKWFYGGWVSLLCSGSIWLRPELPPSSTHKPDHLPGPTLMASTAHLLLQTICNGSCPSRLRIWPFPVLWSSYQHCLGPNVSPALSDFHPPQLYPLYHGVHFMHLSSGINGKLNTGHVHKLHKLS